MLATGTFRSTDAPFNGITRNSPCFFERSYTMVGSIRADPADTGYRTFLHHSGGIGFIDGLIHTQQRLSSSWRPIIICGQSAAFPHPAPIPIRAFRSGPAGSRYRAVKVSHTNQERALIILFPLCHHFSIRTFADFRFPRLTERGVHEGFTFPVSPFVFIQSLTICTRW